MREGEGAQGVDVVASRAGHGGGPLVGMRPRCARRECAHDSAKGPIRGSRGRIAGCEGRTGSVPCASLRPQCARMSTAADRRCSPTAWDRFRPWRRTVRDRLLGRDVLVNATANSAATVDGHPARCTSGSRRGNRRCGNGRARWSPWRWCRRWPGTRDGSRCTSIPGSGRCRCTCSAASPGRSCTSRAWSRCARRRMRRRATDYDFGPWLRELGYEYLKDVRSYASLVLTIEAWRWFLRRWQGEASLLVATRRRARGRRSPNARNVSSSASSARNS